MTGELIAITNGHETFTVEDGGGYAPCTTPTCDHQFAPQGATVWHDSENTEELWEVEK